MLHNNAKYVEQSFSALTRFQTSATVAQTVVSPTASSSFFGAQVANMANLFNEFRLERLHVVIFPTQTQDSGVGSSNTVWALGYAPQVAASAPTTVTDLCELSDVTAITSGMTIPAHFKLSRRSLIGPASLKWYHQGGSTNDTKYQGALYFGALGTYSATWELCMIVQSTWRFKSPVPFGEFTVERKTNVFATDPTPLGLDAEMLSLLDADRVVAGPSEPADDSVSEDHSSVDDFKGLTPVKSAVVKVQAIPSRAKKKTL